MLTRDTGRYSSCFPSVNLISSEKSGLDKKQNKLTTVLIRVLKNTGREIPVFNTNYVRISKKDELGSFIGVQNTYRKGKDKPIFIPAIFIPGS